MWSKFAFLPVVFAPLATLVAQDQLNPPPAPELSPSPSPSPAAAETVAMPAPAADVIPIEGRSEQGAPLDTRNLAPEGTEGPMPDSAFTDPNAIVPDDAPPPLPTTIENLQEKARRLSIRYKEVRVEAEKDPKVVSLREQAETAKTPEDKRAAMREYYRLLFKKMTSMDKSLAERCKLMESAYIRRLAQERVEPTIPLNPPPTPEPLN